MNHKQSYETLLEKLELISASLGGAYITDMCVDAENVTGFSWDAASDDKIWVAMQSAAEDAAVNRLVEQGVDPNDYGITY